jgi:hypothetical protein
LRVFNPGFNLPRKLYWLRLVVVVSWWRFLLFAGHVLVRRGYIVRTSVDAQRTLQPRPEDLSMSTVGLSIWQQVQALYALWEPFGDGGVAPGEEKPTTLSTSRRNTP